MQVHFYWNIFIYQIVIECLWRTRQVVGLLLNWQITLSCFLIYYYFLKWFISFIIQNAPVGFNGPSKVYPTEFLNIRI